jgi:PAS domain S-box-containing protein
MVESTFTALTFNATLLLLCGLVYDLLYPIRVKRASLMRTLSVGLLIGVIGILLMSTRWQFVTGITFDTRSILLSISGLYFGLVPTSVAVVVTMGFRIFQGGSGTITGVLVIFSSAAIGLLWRNQSNRKIISINVTTLYSLGLAVHIAMLLLMFTLPGQSKSMVLRTIALPVMVIYPVGTLLLGLVLQKRNQNIQTAVALDDYKRELLTMINSIMDAVISTDKEGIIQLFNPAAEKLTGWSRSEAIGQMVDSVIDLREDIGDTRLLSGIRFVGGSSNIQGILVSRKGDRSHVIGRHAPIQGEDQKYSGNIYLFRDIEHEMKTQQQIMRNAKLESIGVLAGGIAHDFNNLLSGLFGYIELAHESTDNADVIELLEKAQGVYERSKNLTGQLLTFAKGGAPVSGVFDLETVIRKTAAFVTSGSNTAVDIAIHTELKPCFGDKHQIAQVVENLILNARQAMPDGGHISITLDLYEAGSENEKSLRPGMYLKFQIEDTGIGIPPERLDHIFDPFYTTKKQGNGLGLSISHSIIQRHFGTIEVTSALGEGTTFTCYLPAVVSQG